MRLVPSRLGSSGIVLIGPADQSRRGLTSMIVQKAMFQRDAAVMPVSAKQMAGCKLFKKSNKEKDQSLSS